MKSVSSFSLSLAALLCLSPLNAEEGTEIFSQEAPDVQAAPEEQSVVEEVRYRDPYKAMYDRRASVVEIEILPAWNLTEAQMETAKREPVVKEGSNPVRYLYPEDIAATEEEKTSGAALTDKQRANMKKARRRAMDAACMQAYHETERYNKEHSEEIAGKEKQGKHIVINLKKQQGYLKDGEKVLLTFSVCSGRKGKSTPRGHFHVLDKDLHHHSNLYNNASMPYFMRLTMGGVGLHQGHLAGYPASHGCIRLSQKTARYLFNCCAVGTPVFVY